MFPTCCLNLMRARQCCRKSLFSEKKVTEWSWQKSQGMLNEKPQYFLNKECPYCPVKYTAFLLFSLLPPLSVMKEGKGGATDEKN